MLLSVRNLSVLYVTETEQKTTLQNINLNVEKGEMFGLVGESGAGKSVLAKSILNILEKPGRISNGEVIFEGENLLSFSKYRVRSVRGNKISLIVGNPKSRLDPLTIVGKQIADIYQSHKNVSNEDAKKRAIEMLNNLAINDPERRFFAYPHELSGGMAQRVLITMAMINSPKLLIADDATAGLDVTVQTQVLDEMIQLAKEEDLAVLMITHNLGIVAQYCDKVGIMRDGEILEQGSVSDVFLDPQHTYTQSLLESVGFDYTP